MKYFVTGGAGFIGSHLVDRLMNMGEVTVYDNLSSGKKEFIAHHFRQKGFRFICADLLDRQKLINSIAGHQVAFHMAANSDVRLGAKRTDLDMQQGTVVTYNVMEAMRQTGVKKIIFASSGTVYGETYGAPVEEHYGPLLPISLYGASKLASESMISAFCHIFDMQAWIFRFANVVGDRATHGVIYDFLGKLQRNSEELEILGDGTQEKPYLVVDDCVDGILYGFQKANDKVNILNLSCDSTTSVNSIAEILVREMGLSNVRLKYTGGDRGWPGDVPKVRYNTEKMEKLGWRARFTSDQAVIETIRRLLSKTTTPRDA